MNPPSQLYMFEVGRRRLLDRHGGFTIESKPPLAVAEPSRWKRINRFDMAAREYKGRLRIGDSLYRSGHVLDKLENPVASLLAWDDKSFYQQNKDVTVAFYRIYGYAYPMLAWFDNQTGERIA